MPKCLLESCNNEFEQVLSNTKKYCSKHCQQRAAYLRQYPGAKKGFRCNQIRHYTTIAMEDDLYQTLIKLAKHRSVSLSQVVHDLLRAHLAEKIKMVRERQMSKVGWDKVKEIGRDKDHIKAA